MFLWHDNDVAFKEKENLWCLLDAVLLDADAVAVTVTAAVIMVDHNLSELVLSVVKKQPTFVMLL